jgi:DNA adenine methylase
VVEPFCGALNVSVALVRHDPQVRVLASDKHEDLIDMWRAVKGGWLPPTDLSRDTYHRLMDAPPSPLRTFAGYGCSFGGKWFGGYASDPTGRNYCRNAHNSIAKIRPYMANIEFRLGDYRDQVIPEDCVVYCDPPYLGATKPGTRDGFDHLAFWGWVFWLPAPCFVSEYQAPPVASEIWSKQVLTDMRGREGRFKRTEKLFGNRPVAVPTLANRRYELMVA